jgi:THAP4-like, heme-binding beta-barrel domain
MSAAPPPLHDALVELAFLLGEWRGPGHGEYPTIAPFDYVETVVFAHSGKPFIAYTQRTVDRTTGLPLHAEAGYLRRPRAAIVELVIAQPSGIVEVQEGTIDLGAHGARFELRSRVVAATTSAKRVDTVERSIVVDGDELHYTLRMAAVGQPLQHHLEATLRRS